MVFTSIQYLVFFPFVVTVFYLLPHNKRWIFLLVSSCYFYAIFIPKYIVLIAFLIGVDYLAGIFIEDGSRLTRRLALILSVLSNVGVLIFFKYFNFINSNVESMFRYLGFNYTGHESSYPLPLGLSFFIFQSMSYTFDVFYKKIKAERHLGIYALYVMFFPQLVAGPIERSTNLLPQFRKIQMFSYRRAIDGLRLILWGFFQKLVIADRVAVYVNHAYSSPNSVDGLGLLISTLFFSFQIFFDFSAYSTIAIGTARVLGFNLMKNFDNPYFSVSMAEFWRRWHISLSTWFRDYVYYPLGGNRVNKIRWALNIFIIFILSGLWHGANWTFAFWGAFHFSLLILENYTPTLNNQIISPILKYFRIFRTFSLVCFGWIFFRSQSVAEAINICGKIISSLFNFSLNNLHSSINLMPTSRPEFIFAVAISIGGLIFGFFQAKINKWVNRQKIVFRWALYYAFLFMFISFAQFHTREFIYFQF